MEAEARTLNLGGKIFVAASARSLAEDIGSKTSSRGASSSIEPLAVEAYEAVVRSSTGEKGDGVRLQAWTRNDQVSTESTDDAKQASALVGPWTPLEELEARRIADVAQRAERRDELRTRRLESCSSVYAPPRVSLTKEELSEAARVEEIARRAELRAAQRLSADEAETAARAPLVPQTQERSGGTSKREEAREMEPEINRELALRVQEAADRAERESQEGFWCADCQDTIRSQTRRQHLSSTVHLFNKQFPTSRNQIWLPESNKGYQLLERMGWRDSSGLGPEGEGRVDPVSTNLKRDRKGLGLAREVKRVTHFPSHDEREAHRSKDGLSRAQREHLHGARQPKALSLHHVSRQQRKDMERSEKRREKRIRIELRDDDIPPDLAPLLYGS